MAGMETFELGRELGQITQRLEQMEARLLRLEMGGQGEAAGPFDDAIPMGADGQPEGGIGGFLKMVAQLKAMLPGVEQAAKAATPPSSPAPNPSNGVKPNG